MSLFSRRRRTYDMTSDDLDSTPQDRAFASAMAVEYLRRDPAWRGSSDADRRQTARRLLFTRYLVQERRGGRER